MAQPDPIEPGICVAAFDPDQPKGPLGTKGEAKWFSIEEIENADAWFGLTRRTVVGLAPDGVERVTFNTPAERSR